MTGADARTGEAIWEAGDFRRISGWLVLPSELLCEAVELHARERVLDVGCGNGNTSLAAARRRAVVVGIDPTASFVEQARDRAKVEGLEIDFRDGNAERLDFPDRSFDVVLSSFAVAFASDAEAAARELVRVTKVGGRIGLANWTGRGAVADVFELVAGTLRAGGYPFDPARWGRPESVAELLGPSVRTLRAERVVRWMRADSVASQVAGWERFLGPVVSASRRLDEPGRAALRKELTAAVERHNTAHDGTVYAANEYLEYVGQVSVG